MQDNSPTDVTFSRAAKLVVANGGLIAVVATLAVVIDRLAPSIGRLVIAVVGFCLAMALVMGGTFLAAHRAPPGNAER